jgi:hypothetical protein
MRVCASLSQAAQLRACSGTWPPTSAAPVSARGGPHPGRLVFAWAGRRLSGYRVHRAERPELWEGGSVRIPPQRRRPHPMCSGASTLPRWMRCPAPSLAPPSIEPLAPPCETAATLQTPATTEPAARTPTALSTARARGRACASGASRATPQSAAPGSRHRQAVSPAAVGVLASQRPPACHGMARHRRRPWLRPAPRAPRVLPADGWLVALACRPPPPPPLLVGPRAAPQPADQALLTLRNAGPCPLPPHLVPRRTQTPAPAGTAAQMPRVRSLQTARPRACAALATRATQTPAACPRSQAPSVVRGRLQPRAKARRGVLCCDGTRAAAAVTRKPSQGPRTLARARQGAHDLSTASGWLRRPRCAC